MVLSLGAPAFAEGGKSPVFKDGAAQSILQYTNLRGTNYTNEGSDILRFCVYVETDHDTDGDGKADLVEALVQVPRAAPTQQNPNQIFPMGDGFGFCVFHRKQFFTNGMPCRPESKPRDPKKKKTK